MCAYLVIRYRNNTFGSKEYSRVDRWILALFSQPFRKKSIRRRDLSRSRSRSSDLQFLVLSPLQVPGVHQQAPRRLLQLALHLRLRVELRRRGAPEGRPLRAAWGAPRPPPGRPLRTLLLPLRVVQPHLPQGQGQEPHHEVIHFGLF